MYVLQSALLSDVAKADVLQTHVALKRFQRNDAVGCCKSTWMLQKHYAFKRCFRMLQKQTDNVAFGCSKSMTFSDVAFGCCKAHGCCKTCSFQTLLSDVAKTDGVRKRMLLSHASNEALLSDIARAHGCCKTYIRTGGPTAQRPRRAQCHRSLTNSRLLRSSPAASSCSVSHGALSLARLLLFRV